MKKPTIFLVVILSLLRLLPIHAQHSDTEMAFLQEVQQKYLNAESYQMTVVSKTYDAVNSIPFKVDTSLVVNDGINYKVAAFGLVTIKSDTHFLIVDHNDKNMQLSKLTEEQQAQPSLQQGADVDFMSELLNSQYHFEETANTIKLTQEQIGQFLKVIYTFDKHEKTLAKIDYFMNLEGAYQSAHVEVKYIEVRLNERINLTEFELGKYVKTSETDDFSPAPLYANYNFVYQNKEMK